MNAIILAAGKGSRMFADGLSTFKPFLPITNTPNIVRTILFLNNFGIEDITILANEEYIEDFQTLKDKYSCKIIPVRNSPNTLHCIARVLTQINNTFIIEGDVALTKNIFFHADYSFYFIKKYKLRDNDAWCPILNQRRIIGFKIGLTRKPCLFGISFWHEKDCSKLKEAINKALSQSNSFDSKLFWDDCVINILDQVEIYSHEIKRNDAHEMNNLNEYDLASKSCTKYYKNCRNFILDYTLRLEDNSVLHFKEDIEECVRWQKALEDYITLDPSSFAPSNEISTTAPESVFHKHEYPFILIDNHKKPIAYIDLAEAESYVLLRRIFVEENNRRMCIGTKVLDCIYLYCRLVNKELRVNVYSSQTEMFYKKNNLVLDFKTYIKKP